MNQSAETSKNNLFSDFETLKSVKIVVVIPVKNEEERIENTLNSFINQVDQYGIKLDSNLFEILILANNCSDNSVSIIKKITLENPNVNICCNEVTLNSSQANIGHVRKLLMDTAYERLSKNGGGIIMTTDGDTEVSKDWIAQNKLEIENGADAVGGRIFLFKNEMDEMDEITRSIHFKDEIYQLLIAEAEAKILKDSVDPHPRHHQHFNGSFAITTECYQKSGGVPEVAYLEDCALFEKLQNIDAKIRHSHNVSVYTSARCDGRTQVGLSYQLNIWKNLEKIDSEIFVESADSIINRFKTKKLLLSLWSKRNELSKEDLELNIILDEYHLDDELKNSFKSSKFFGEWYSTFMQLNSNQQFAPVTIENAISALEKVIVDL